MICCGATVPVAVHGKRDTCPACGPIAEHRGIDFGAPRIDTTAHALREREATFAEPMGHAQAPHAVVAVHDDRLVAPGIKFSRPLGGLLHRQELGTVNSTDCMLVGTPAVDQQTVCGTLTGAKPFGSPGRRLLK